MSAPWPIVNECHWPAPSLVKQNHSCPQCDGSHEHEWIAWHDAPHPASDPTGSSLVGRTSGPGIPVRCRICGGRKCDIDACRLRRHHREEHEEF